MNMHYQEYLPSEALKPYVQCYWYHVLDGKPGEKIPIQYCVPLGMVEIIHNLKTESREVCINGTWQTLSNFFMVGLGEDPAVWKGTGVSVDFGIRLKPESLLQLFNVRVSDLYMGCIDIVSVFGHELDRYSQDLQGATDVNALIQIAESFLISRLQHLKSERNYVIEATRLIRESKGALSIDELSKNLYISKRQLQRSFKEHYGTSPKTYQRIIRFSNAYHSFQKSKTPPTWADISYSFGYADQAHFIRDFKYFTGEVPTILNRNEDQFFQKGSVI
jgi:AraC-like DNA-binding protein